MTILYGDMTVSDPTHEGRGLRAGILMMDAVAKQLCVQHEGLQTKVLKTCRTQFIAAHHPLNRTIMNDIEDEISTTSSALYHWGDALDHAFTTWQNALNSADIHDVDIATLSYDDGNGHKLPVPFDTKYENMLTAAFNQADLNHSGTSTKSPTLCQHCHLHHPYAIDTAKRHL